MTSAIVDSPAVDAAEHVRLAHKIAARWRKLAALLGLDADDLAGEALLGLSLAAKEWDPDRGVTFGTFAYRVIDHRVRNALRAASRRGRLRTQSLTSLDGGQQEPPDCRAVRDHVRDGEDRALVVRLLETAALTDRQREGIMRRFYGGETLRAIAASWGVTDGAVSQTIERALENLREAAGVDLREAG